MELKDYFKKAIPEWIEILLFITCYTKIVNEGIKGNILEFSVCALIFIYTIYTLVKDYIQSKKEKDLKQ